jgi:transposase
MDARTVAVDLAKDVFEVAVMGAHGKIAERWRGSRRRFATFVDTLEAGTLVVMEACGSAHHWARRCQRRGAVACLLPAQYVRPYVRRNKTDRADTEALLEAHRCGAIHPVPVKTAEQQMLQGLHRLRQQWQKTRTARINLVHALLREQGYVVPRGGAGLSARVLAIIDDDAAELPGLTRQTVRWVLDEVRRLDGELRDVDRRLRQLARADAAAMRLLQIPGIGVMTATAFIAAVPHIQAFRRGRQFASWLGLTPREYSSGMRRVLGGITKRGDRYLRTLLAHGARSVLGAALRRRGGQAATRLHEWALETAARRGRNRTIMAIANKLARIVWAVWSRERTYEARPLVA